MHDYTFPAILLILGGIAIFVLTSYNFKKGKYRGSLIDGYRILNENEDPEPFYFGLFFSFFISVCLIIVGIALLFVQIFF